LNLNQLNEIFLHQLTLSGVREGETLSILTRGNERGDYADAALWAAQELGANAFHMRLPAARSASGAWAVGESGLGSNPVAVEALKQSDMLLDLTFLLFSKEQFAIQDAQTRILTVVEPAPLLARLMPTPELRERVEVGAELLAKAQTMRITSAGGTDVTYRLGVYPTLSEYGYTDTPGRWDHWPAAFVFTGGADDGVDGTIVLSPGDVLLPFNTYVQSPVTLTIEKGFITDIVLHRFVRRCARVRYVARRVGARRTRAVARAHAVSRRHGHGIAVVLWQRHVLHRSQQRARRAQRHSLSFRHSHARMHPLPR
jgi:2,5-dihydroxypyridine 5,6-dioxygenase